MKPEIQHSQLGEHKSLPIWQFASLDAWQDWLEHNHRTATSGIWVKIAKKNATQKTISYEEAREGALCYGWIDSVANKLDESFYLLKLTPRRPRSIWSQINVELCESYVRDGKMRPAGQHEIDAAKKDGRWAAAYGKNDLKNLPSDLIAALSEEPTLHLAFRSLSNSRKQALLLQLNSARRPETRTKRLQDIIQKAKNSEKL